MAGLHALHSPGQPPLTAQKDERNVFNLTDLLEGSIHISTASKRMHCISGADFQFSKSGTEDIKFWPHVCELLLCSAAFSLDLMLIIMSYISLFTAFLQFISILDGSVRVPGFTPSSAANVPFKTFKNPIGVSLMRRDHVVYTLEDDACLLPSKCFRLNADTPGLYSPVETR